MSTLDPTIAPFLTPRGIAVVGVSRHPAKLGYGIAQNLVQGGYPGAIHFVNPKGGVLFERPIHPSIADVPDPVDLAVLLIPPDDVPAALAACAARGIRAAIIASGGFREVGPEGAALEDACTAVARRHNMRLMGPNCIGVIDTHVPFDTTFLPPPGPPAGDVAFLSHSGAICAAIIDWARGQGFGFSQLISLGNQLDVTETDLLPAVVDNPHTAVVTLYLEGLGHGRDFVAVASGLTRRKPILALKVGRSQSGQQAVASHTGALAGSESAYAAAFRRAGVIRATTAEEMFDWARALAWCPLPAGRRVAVLTNAGGPGVMAADALERHGLTLAALDDATRDALHAILAPAASTANPVDMLASASPQQYAAGLRLLLADAGVDAVLVILPPPPMFAAGGVARELIPLIQMADKPVVVALMGHHLVQEAAAYFRAARVPEFRFPETAVAALAVLADRAALLARPLPSPVDASTRQPEQVAALLEGQTPGFLPQEVAQGILAAYGIALPPRALAVTAAAAVTYATEIGFPVVLKIASPDIVHKSDVGGVLLNMADATAVQAGFTQLVAAARAAQPEARIDGVEIQPMLRGGQELIVGSVADAQFGPVLMFGSGGVEVEGLQDVAFALAPVTPADLDYLLARTWAGRRLKGHRTLTAVDETAVRAVVVRLGHLAADFPQLAEIEINPLRATADGAVALDVRMRLADTNERTADLPDAPD